MSKTSMEVLRSSTFRAWRILRFGGGFGIDVAALTLACFVLQSLLVAHASLRLLGDSLLSAGSVQVEISQSASDQRIQELLVHLESLPSISTVRYLPKEQVLLEELERDPAMEDFLATSGIDNPFSDMVAIELEDAVGYDALRGVLTDRLWRDVVAGTALSAVESGESNVSQVLSALDAVSIVSLLLVLGSMLAVILLSIATVSDLALGRVDVAMLETASGRTQADRTLPIILAGGMLLLGSLLLGTLLLIGILFAVTSFSTSDILVSFLREAHGALLPLSLSVLGLEAIAMVVLAWAIGRSAHLPDM